jgi:predicted glutamine amidotransferase
MCRLLAWASAQPVAVSEALETEELEAFKLLSLEHADGWGIAWWPDESQAYAPNTMRSTACAGRDPEFDSAMRTLRSDLGFVHLRWATPGLPVVSSNTHPFSYGQWAFAHNGAIHPQSRLDELLRPSWRSRMRGTTDSERYFLAIMSRMEEGASVPDAVAAVVHDVFSRFEPTSLNAMLLGPDALFIISAYDPERAPLHSRGRNGTTQPDAFRYDLHHRHREDSFVIASAGLGQHADAGWRQLANMSLLRLDRRTLHLSQEPLAVASATT